ncbi:glutamate racemase [Nonomuraea sp. MCN248]|uniref:Glutamate racemase n=1 Tax=Nonomuraea corallina TaxID=2989783 RepID=A0ABT4SKH3_9ACTN|nr:glutamate racemase [Nonomuraea corallina]MDA0637716.1 glutamate racemase [Nonomuraea corallina]
MPDASIGIFDSGVGGLTVARAIIDQLPHESITYVADTARQPYGPKRIAEVRAYALEVMDHLVGDGVKMLVIACNSASAAVLRDARERYDLPVVEVIQPATRRAVRATRNGRVGVIATRATIQSMAYHDAFTAAPDVLLTGVAAPRLVEYVERGETMSEELIQAVSGYLEPIQEAGCDTLILGCTHYPLLTGAISYVAGDGVTLVSSADETAKDVYRVLHDRGLAAGSEATPRHRFRATGDSTLFARLGRRFLGPEIDAVEVAPVGGTTVKGGPHESDHHRLLRKLSRP